MPRQPRGRRHWARTAIFFMLLGALTTGAVAWALCALGSAFPERTENGGMRSAEDEILEWPVHVPAEWPQPRMLHSRIGRGLRLDLGNTAAGDDSGPNGTRRLLTEYRITSVRSGWPLLSMQSRTLTVRQRDQLEHVDRTPVITLPYWFLQYVEGISEGYGVTRALPLVPIWPAFLTSTLIYALGFWILLRLPRAVRRQIRSRRGQCVQCGYPRGSSDVCTECGASIPSTARGEHVN